jgi:hypothetical protein
MNEKPTGASALPDVSMIAPPSDTVIVEPAGSDDAGRSS